MLKTCERNEDVVKKRWKQRGMLIGVYDSTERRKCQTKKEDNKILKDARKKETSIVNQYKAGIKATKI
jgi:hypothetical protein